jgi:hypothetical protein
MKEIHVGLQCLQVLWFKRKIQWNDNHAKLYGHVYGGDLAGRPVICAVGVSAQVKRWRNDFSGHGLQNKNGPRA